MDVKSEVKVGDKIKVVKPVLAFGYSRGDEFTVKSVDGQGNVYTFEGNHLLLKEEFEIISCGDECIKIGQRVVGTGTDPDLPEGEEGVIEGHVPGIPYPYGVMRDSEGLVVPLTRDSFEPVYEEELVGRKVFISSNIFGLERGDELMVLEDDGEETLNFFVYSYDKGESYWVDREDFVLSKDELEAEEIKVGELVKMKDGLGKAHFGALWQVEGETGEVISAGAEMLGVKNVVIVKFPSHKSFHALEEELDVVGKADPDDLLTDTTELDQEFSVGEQVKMKDDLVEAHYLGLSRVKGQVGRVKRVSPSGSVVVEFPGHSDFNALARELETVKHGGLEVGDMVVINQEDYIAEGRKAVVIDVGYKSGIHEEFGYDIEVRIIEPGPLFDETDIFSSKDLGKV